MPNKLIRNLPAGAQHQSWFAPNRVVSLAVGASLDTTNIAGVRTNSAFEYQINGAGVEAILPAGQVLWIGEGVNSIKNGNAVSVAVLEVMDA